MYLRVNLKMKPTLCCCFTWIAFIEHNNFTVAFLLIRKTWDGRFVCNIVCTPPPPLPLSAWGGVESGYWENGGPFT